MQSGIFAFFVSAPWMNPFSTGPTPVVVNSIITALCIAILVVWSASLEGRTNSPLASQPAPQNIPTGWLCAAGLSAVAGLIQYGGLAQLFAPWISSSMAGEAYANLRQRNHFASLVDIGLVSVMWGRFVCRPQLRVTSILAMAILFAVANAASSSRTGLFQLVLIMALVCLWRSPGVSWRHSQMLHIASVALGAYVVAIFTLPLLIGLDPNNSGVLGRFRDTSAACQSRLTLWSNVLHLIAQKPWTGWGWGELDYAHFITLYPGNRFCDILDNAHNLPLHLAVELGVPFAVGFCGLCVWLVAREKPWLERNPLRQLAWAVLALIGLHSMLEYPLWYGPFQMTVLLCFYMLGRTPALWRGEDTEVRSLSPMLRNTCSAVALGVMVLCAYAAWDYWRISQIYTVPTQRDPAYREDTLHKIQGSWLFQNQVKFAELSVTPLTSENAVHINTLAKELLHFTPEAKVVKKLIESAVMLGKHEEASFYLARYKAAFPNAPSP